MSDEIKAEDARRGAIEALRSKARDILDWPLAEVETEDGKEVVKPAKWSMADAAKLLQASFKLENSEDEPPQLAFGFELIELGERRRPEHLVDIGVSGWQELYHELIRQGWRWQKAAYMAWRAAPRRHRQPETQAELAELLGYKSDRVFRIWLGKPEQGPLMRQIITGARRMVFELNLADVDHVTIERAADPDGSTADRKLYYDLLDRLQGSETGGQQVDDYSDLSDEELTEELHRLDQILQTAA